MNHDDIYNLSIADYAAIAATAVERTFTEEEVQSYKKEAYQQGYAQAQKDIRAALGISSP